MISVNGINKHIAEKGEGPLVLFLHGFPELWYSWRHQIVYMASQGYRAVAPDLRGFGDTTGAPTGDFTKFTTLHVVGDIIALLDAISPDEAKVFVVGHDWGAIIAWYLCLYRPDRVKALVNLSVHFKPRNPTTKPVDMLRGFYGDDLYIYRFQEKGLGVSADTQITLPPWLSEEDVDYFAGKFEGNGFTGGINYYRAMDLNWELTAPWTEAQVKVPVKFIGGDLDLAYHVPGTKEYIHNGGFQKYVPLLEEDVVMEGVAHFINQEKPDEINNYIHEFLKKF